ncbi:Hypothetical predicted protein [Pelobates cultripes]|uniref:Uncharacterized protein n=1 Tax=Pelobates cultripes TaxID=61616 RepID=A0AAD1QZG9_PELCU|nr:Hypothetical predicted protein [Pelobates cultripes]
MDKYTREKITPRGLRFYKSPSFDQEEEDFIQEWSDLLESFSFGMMNLIIKRRTQTLHKLDVEINETKNSLVEHMSSEQYSNTLIDIQTNLEKLEKSVIDIKKRKYQRDKEDYARGEVRTHTKRNNRFQTNNGQMVNDWDNSQHYYRRGRNNSPTVRRIPLRNKHLKDHRREKSQEGLPQRSKPPANVQPQWEKVVRRKQLRSPIRQKERSPRSNLMIKNTQNMDIHRNKYKDRENSTHNRFLPLATSTNGEDFWNGHMKGRHKDSLMHHMSPGKRRRSLEEGELEEGYVYKKERREKYPRRTGFSTFLNEN